MNNDLILKLTSAYDAGEFDRVQSLISLSLKDIDFDLLPDELVELYYSRFDDMKVDVGMVNNVFGNIRSAGCGQSDALPSISDCIRLALEPRYVEYARKLDEKVIKFLLELHLPMEAGLDNLEAFVAFLRSNGIILPSDATRSIFRCVKRTFPVLCGELIRSPESYQAARRNTID